MEMLQKNQFANTNDIIMAVTSENMEDVCKCLCGSEEKAGAISGHTAIIKTQSECKVSCILFSYCYVF